jgi:amidophosphoribosyltransferase
MPQDQDIRNLVAKMKLMPVPELIKGKRLLFCDDSIVRGTQMRKPWICCINVMPERSIYGQLARLCIWMQIFEFSTSRSEMDLAARQAIIELEGKEPESLDEYCDPANEKYHQMIECIGKRLNFSTLKYQNLHDMLDAIGISPDKICTYCWNGKE